MNKLLVLLVIGASTQTLAQPVPGSLDVHWNEGAADCTATPQDLLQVHAYEPQTIILRQSPCADFEANFMYLLIGSDKALLIDTGAVADPERMPLAATVSTLLPERGGSKLPLVVAHSHSHSDHRAGDPQFASLGFVEVVPTELAGVQSFLGLSERPKGSSRQDLGGRTVSVIPAPGHHEDHLVFYDDRTGVLFSGDFLLPGRLLVDDADAYQASVAGIIDFLGARPVTHVLGGHIELDKDGQLYPHGAEHHPNERRLELTRDDLKDLAIAFDSFNGFYAKHANFVLTNPLRNLLALSIAVLALLGLVAWGLWRIVRRRRRRVEVPA
jgi:glyoxylase-like metal-dependent hydrolase (beta-lactamase superfamily II)